MKNILHFFLGLFLIGAFASQALAVELPGDPVKGQKLYLKFLKNDIGLKGDQIAKMHTTEEWVGILETKETFIQWVSENIENNEVALENLNGKKIDRFFDDIKSFIINYASDSGNVPSC